VVKYEGDVKSLKQWKGGLVERCEKAKEECEALCLCPPTGRHACADARSAPCWGT
jgi:hypothetical protein